MYVDCDLRVLTLCGLVKFRKKVPTLSSEECDTFIRNVRNYQQDYTEPQSQKTTIDVFPVVRTSDLETLLYALEYNILKCD